MSDNLTTVVIKRSTREALKHAARKDQNYDDFLNELLKLKEQKISG